jgi:peroxiredoxin Q/BCP
MLACEKLRGVQLLKIYFMVAVLLFGAMWLRSSHAADIPQVGQDAPDFALSDQQGKLQRLADYRGKWLVLYFYPKDNTPHCTTEACTFRDDIAQIHAMGAAVLGVSVDDVDSHVQFARKHHLSFPLLADPGGVVAARYGSLTNLFLVRFAQRNTFIINPQGKVAKVYTGVDAQIHAKQVLKDLAALTGSATPSQPNTSFPSITP